jgi:hypothetical protein
LARKCSYCFTAANVSLAAEDRRLKSSRVGFGHEMCWILFKAVSYRDFNSAYQKQKLAKQLQLRNSLP